MKSLSPLVCSPIDYEIVYVKQPKAKTPNTIKWKVRLGIHEFDYFTGLGHIKNYTDHKSIDRLNQVVVLLSTGKPRHGPYYAGDKPLELVTPSLDDVIYCLLADSEVLNYACFEDWCYNFGYNSDSIRDKGVYDACLSNALKLSSVLNIEKLKPLFVDY